MQVSSLNEVKIYSLSCGKSLPEWLSDRKKRALQKKNVDVRRRIELIQDFEMPTVCTTIKVSKDGQYILATGTYKPRVRCYDTYQLSLKFERCLDSEVVTFEILSDDYSKIVFLHNDRYIEFHSQSGFYYKTRIPKFGRDFSYHYPSCDLYFVGASSEVYRLNLEQGRYLNPLQTDAAENNVCDINAVHGLFATGTIEGRVECWDPRVRKRVGVLDCALNSVTADSEINSLPTISALKFNGALSMAVGTSTGQVNVTCEHVSQYFGCVLEGTWIVSEAGVERCSRLLGPFSTSEDRSSPLMLELNRGSLQTFLIGVWNSIF